MNILLLCIIFVLTKQDDKVKVTGSTYIGAGFDYPTNTFKQKIFQNTYDYTDPTHIWKNPFYPGADEYVPQEVHLTNTPESMDLEGTIVHHLFDNYTREYSQHYNDGFLFFIHTTDIYYYIHRVILFDNSKGMFLMLILIVGFAFKRIAWYTLEVNPIVIFDPSKYFTPGFKAAMDALPVTMKSEYEKIQYRQFLHTYGTSFIRRVVMGGELSLNSWIHNCFQKTQTISWIKEMTSFSFLGIFSFGKVKEKYKEKIDVKFLEHVESDALSIGGLWKNNSYWEQYKLTLKGDLIEPIYYSFDNITDLFSDKQKKYNMQSTIDEYVLDAKNQVNAYLENTKKEKKLPYPAWCDKMKKRK